MSHGELEIILEFLIPLCLFLLNKYLFYNWVPSFAKNRKVNKRWLIWWYIKFISFYFHYTFAFRLEHFQTDISHLTILNKFSFILFLYEKIDVIHPVKPNFRILLNQETSHPTLIRFKCTLVFWAIHISKKQMRTWFTIRTPIFQT